MTMSPIAGALGAAEGPVWLRVGTLVDGTSHTPLRDAHVVYDREHIRFVGHNGQMPPRDVVRPGQDRPDIEAPLHTLLPGLIDAHAHLYLSGSEMNAERRAANRRRDSTEQLADALARLDVLEQLGIAGIRDGGDNRGIGLALARSSRTHSDGSSKPHVDSPGAAIHREGRYGAFMSAPVERCASLEACVEERVARGADRIKIIASGIVDFRDASAVVSPQFTAPEIARMVRKAASLGRQTFAHASGVEGIDSAIDGGVDSVEHGFFITDDQLARMRDRAIAWVPTFAPVHAQLAHAEMPGGDDTLVASLRAILDGHAERLRSAISLGVRVVAGSDAGSPGVPHGLGLLSEMEVMESAGMRSLEVLNAATGAGADRFAYSDRIGRIAPGYRSRFTLTYHDPLASVANLRKPRMVVFDGAVFETDGHLDTSDL